MSDNSKQRQLAVAALQNGTVIDHIPSSALFKVVKILNLENAAGAVTIGYNLESRKIGRKGIIKVSGVEFDEDTLNRIALIAPRAVVNVIRNYEVAEKRPVVLRDELRNIVRCPNPKCISNNEPMATVFNVTSRGPVQIRCRYCNHAVDAGKVVIL